MRFAEAVKLVRQKEKLSYRVAARQMGIDTSALVRFERGAIVAGPVWAKINLWLWGFK